MKVENNKIQLKIQFKIICLKTVEILKHISWCGKKKNYWISKKEYFSWIKIVLWNFRMTEIEFPYKIQSKTSFSQHIFMEVINFQFPCSGCYCHLTLIWFVSSIFRKIELKFSLEIWRGVRDFWRGNFQNFYMGQQGKVPYFPRGDNRGAILL
jgi:hypothetical protein